MEILEAVIVFLVLVLGVPGLVVGLGDRKIRPWVLVALVLIVLLIVMDTISAIRNPGENNAAYWNLAGTIVAGLFWSMAIGTVAGIVWWLMQWRTR